MELAKIWTRAAPLEANAFGWQRGFSRLDIMMEKFGEMPFERDEDLAAGLVRAVKAVMEITAGYPEAREQEQPLLKTATLLANGVVRDDLAINTLADIMALAQDRNDLKLLSWLAGRYLTVSFRKHKPHLEPVMLAIATLHRLEYPEAGFLLGTVKEILGLFLRSPFVDLHAAYAVVSLANLCRELNLEEPPQDWILRLEEMAERVREELYNIWMCSDLSRVYVATGDHQLADRWLQRAITQARQFMSEAGVPGGLAVSVVTGIITAWEALPVEDQKRQLPELRYLLRFVLDYEKRDRLLGRLAVSVWDDKELFRGMFEEITLGGLEVILEALEQLEKGTAPAELLPIVFHDILEKASRNGTGFFAGNALLASQIAVKQQTYQTGAMVAALTAIEGFMREIAPLPGEGVQPGS